ncbi:MAG: serine/threonine-protein phosphatase [Desulfobacteraceae bacterium]|nr:MAG: serine/threonine-protein phosphatase [Desulfobacteraceae bacterium]
MPIISSASLTDIGRKRAVNEDACLIDDTLGLYVVSDGMGGHRAGEVASRIVVDALHTFMAASPSDNALENSRKALSPDAGRLLAGIHNAHMMINEKEAQNTMYKGMGATVSAVFFSGEHTFVAANVGDSPIYLVREDRIEMISVLHTVRAEYEKLSKEGTKPSREIFRHMLTRAMGGDRDHRADIREIQYLEGDRVVICSDGLSEKVEPFEIREMVLKHPPSMSCRHLVDIANHRGGDDNITVIVLELTSPNRLKRLSNRLKSGFRKFLS